MESRFRIGIYTATHGLKGEIKVYPTTDDPARFSSLNEVILETKEGELSLTVERARLAKGLVILKFREIGDINGIERFRGSSLFVSRENAAPLAEGSYYIADIIGARVETDDGRYLGKLQQVLPTGANDVFVVRDPEKKNSREYLLPNIRECVQTIDPEAMRITVHMMDGLEDL